MAKISTLLRGRKLGPKGQEYATVWRLNIPFTSLNVRLHHWYGHDDPRAFHSHPQWFCTLVLRGGYTDVSPDIMYQSAWRPGMGHRPPYQPHGKKAEFLSAGSFRRRPANYLHTVQGVLPGTWTLLLFGGQRQRWGFYKNGSLKRYQRDKWFAEYGHHTQDGSPPIRMRPDGSLIQ